MHRENILSRAQVFAWHKKFSVSGEGVESLSLSEQQSPPKAGVAADNIETVCGPWVLFIGKMLSILIFSMINALLMHSIILLQNAGCREINILAGKPYNPYNPNLSHCDF